MRTQRQVVGLGVSPAWNIKCRALELPAVAAHTIEVSNKEIVADLLQRIPDSASLTDIAREIEFVAAVRQGIAELDRGQGIPIEEVERELPAWIIK